MSERLNHTSSAGEPDSVDWPAVEKSTEYQELRAAQRRFLIPASVVYLAVYFGFLLLTLGLPALFSQSLHGGLNLGFALMSSMFVLVWLGVLLHNRIAHRYWDPRIARVHARAERLVSPTVAPGGQATPDTQVTP